MNFKRFFTSLMIIFTFCMIGCQNEAISSQSNQVAVAANNGAATLRVSIDEPQSESRAALPSVDLSQLSFIMLTYDDPADYTASSKTVGIWGSTDETSCVDEMRNAVLAFQIGTYNFSLTAMASGMMFSEKKTFTVKEGENHLSFTPKLEILSDDFRGKGNLSVTLDLSCDITNLKKATGGLYSINGLPIVGAEDKDLTIDNYIEIGYKRTWVEYALQNVPSGDYVVIFKFFADNDKINLLSTYREYTSIIDDMTSDSECVIEALGKVFSIEYEKNGGQFANDYTPPVSYTRQTAVVTLPPADKITRPHYVFGGWYDNADFNGDVIKNIPTGNTGNKKYYANWIPEVSILFAANGGNFIVEEAKTDVLTKIVTKDQSVDLPTVASLRLIGPNSRGFMGWSKNAGSSSIDYADGAKIKLGESIILYAIWSISKIQDDIEDYDGDGLTNSYELNVSHTNPLAADTDGDGWTDKEEVEMYSESTLTFSPLIADMPFLEVVFDKKPSIQYVYEVSDSDGVSEEISNNEGTTLSSSKENSNTTSRTLTHGWGITLGGEYKFAPSSEAGFTGKFELNYNGNVAYGDEYTYSQGMSEETSKEWSHSKSTSSEHGKTVSGGKIAIQARFRNTGNIAYNIESVTVSVSRIPNNDPSVLVPIASITKENLGVIGPGLQSGPVNLAPENDLTLEETEELLKWSNGIHITVSAYKISRTKNDGTTLDFSDSMTRVKAQTASIYVDWGVGNHKEAKTYNVSVFNRYNVNHLDISQAYIKPSLKYIFDNILKYKGNYTLENNKLKSMHGIVNAAEIKDGGWFISHYYTENNQRMLKLYGPNTNYNLDEIIINAGDEIAVIYDVDQDQDGVSLNEERSCGTDDTKRDTDGDGLTDFEEIYGWYKGHLSPKYADEDGKRVCSNPRLKDSDGDDLVDYITNYDSATNEEKAKVDDDPIDPKMKDDTSLKDNPMYATASGGQFKKLTFYKSGDRKYIASVNANEYIYLDILPKALHADVKYKVKAPGMSNEAFNLTEYSAIKKTEAIQLSVGTSEIIVECTAPDGITKAEYKITVVSSFRAIKNFKVVSPQLGNGRVNLTWDSYADTRSEKSDGGYIIYGVQTKTLQDNPELNKNDINPPKTTNLADNIEFRVKIDNAVLKSGVTSLDLAPNTDYCLYLFAFAHSTMDVTYKYTCLGKAYVKSGKPEKGILKFYAHYIYDYKDQDGGYDPEYYWTFSGGKIKDISSLNIGVDEKKEFDDNDDKTYCFGKGKIHKYDNDPLKFSDCTKVLTTEFSRKANIDFTITWIAWEYDRGSGDDKLGTVTANFSYTASSDTWTCKWTSTKGADSHSTITAGERTGKMNGTHKDGKRWELHNSTYGEIEFHWDWGWDYKE